MTTTVQRAGAKTSTSERRRETRFRTENLTGTLPFDHRITVLDMSLDGLAVESTQQLVPGRSYTVSLPLGDHATQTTGSVVWCRLFGTQRRGDDVVPIFRAGLRLDESLAPEVVQGVGHQGQQRPTIGTRPQARFKTPELASAVLGGDAPFQVETLSRFGMAAVMEFSPSLRSVVDFVLCLDGAEVEISGRVADVMERGDRPAAGATAAHYVVGIEFSDLRPDAQKTLTTYLARHSEAS